MTTPEGQSQPPLVEINPALQEVLIEMKNDPKSTMTDSLRKAIEQRRYFTRPLMPGEIADDQE